MSAYFACLMAVFAAVGALCGVCAVPWLADKALRRAYNRSLAWWESSYRELIDYQAVYPGQLPKPSDKGAAGAVGVWLADALSLARQGDLARERAQMLADAGLDVDPSAAVRAERDQAERCSFRPGALVRAALGVMTGAAFAALSASGLPLQLDALFAVCLLAMVVGVACDLRARMIPIECCAAIALAGGAFQLLRGGLQALGSGLLFAVAVVVACWFARKALKAGPRAVGGGDMRCMAALALASGPGAVVGAIACYIAAAAVSALGVLTRKLKFSDGLPMAPFLMLWLIFGGVVVA